MTKRIEQQIADIIDGWGNISAHRRMELAKGILKLKDVVVLNEDQSLPSYTSLELGGIIDGVEDGSMWEVAMQAIDFIRKKFKEQNWKKVKDE